MLIDDFLIAGTYRTALKQIRGGKIHVSDMFRTGGTFGPIIVANLLYFFILCGGSLYAYFPGRLLVGVFYLTFPIIADRRAGPIDAIRMSFKALKNQALTSLVFAITVAFVSVAGLLVFVVGGLFTIPISYLAQIIVYRDFFGLEPLPPVQPVLIEMLFPPQPLMAASTTADHNAA